MDIEQTPFQKQTDDLLAKEKVARLNNLAFESAKIIQEIVTLCWDNKEYKIMFDLIKQLAKKRGQFKKSQIEMVQQCMSYINQIKDLELKMQLVTTIKDVCDKKIFLEVEYARCCWLIVKQKETEEDINEAARILQDVQVETYGSMDKREKLEFILYQMRIVLRRDDYVRLVIVSRKINPKNLNEKGILDLKILYYSYMATYYIHEGDYLKTAEAYKAIFDTLKENPELQDTKKVEFDFNVEYQNVLENYILYIIIAPQTPEKDHMLNGLKQFYFNIIEKYERLNFVVDQFLLQELISTSPDEYGLQDLLVFSTAQHNYQDHLEAFRKELITHNILVIQKYYEQITFKRFAELLKINNDEAEDVICDMINAKLVFCKIDRVDGTINFNLRKSENEILNNWSFDINKILDLLDSTTNLIKREEEFYK